MKVKNWMKKRVITIKKEASVQEALDLMKKHSIRHLPVVEDNKKSLVGLVTESNLRQFFFLSMVEKISVQDAMIAKPVAIDPDANVELAASVIYRHKIGCLPVLDNKKLVGIITITDILTAFIEMMGLLRGTSRIDIELTDKKGAIQEVSEIIKQHDAEIISIGMVGQPSGKKTGYVRLEKCNPEPIVKSLQERGYKVLSVIN